MSLIETGRIDSNDIDELAETHEPWEMRHTQLSLGKFRTRSDFVGTERVIVYRQWWNRSVLARGMSPADYAVIGSTGSPSVHVNWCGHDLSEARLAWTRPGGEVDFTTGERTDQVVALVRTDLLASFLGDEELVPEPHGLHLQCPGRLGKELIATIQSILTRYASQPKLSTGPHEAQELESEVLSVFAACAYLGPSPGEAQSRRTNALRCAMAHANANIRTITVPELAKVAGVSQRTLEYAFREGLGITPLGFLRRCRLNGAHCELRSAMVGSTTVTDIALRWGFSSMGRFSVEHKAMFGASPSQILAETRSPTGRLLLTGRQRRRMRSAVVNPDLSTHSAS